MSDSYSTPPPGDLVPLREATRHMRDIIGNVEIVKVGGRNYVRRADLERFAGRGHSTGGMGAGDRIAGVIDRGQQQRSRAFAAVRRREASDAGRRRAGRGAKEIRSSRMPSSPSACSGTCAVASLDLSNDDLDRLADALAARLSARLGAREAAAPDKWMKSADAADYLGLTRYALDKLCAARTVPFTQDTPGGKRWFKAADLDAWRRGRRSWSPVATSRLDGC